MFSLDDRPPPPALPHFTRDLEQVLLAAARASSPARPSSVTRRRALAGLAATAAVAAVGTGVGYAVSASHPGTVPHIVTGPPVHINLSSFSVDTNPGGTVTVTLIRDRVPDPATLRHALAEARIPALVTIGSVCLVPGPSAVFSQVIVPEPHRPNGNTTLTIVPSAMPAGTELSIGYYRIPGGNGIHVSLLPAHARPTCTSTPPAPPHPRQGGAAP